MKYIKKTFFYLKYNFLRKFRIIFNLDQIIEIDGKQLILPPDHLLSLYIMIYPNYDKFLPNQIKQDKLDIIDIGANVGDTLIRILSDCNNYHCIEPNEYFLKYLKININKNLDKYKDIKINIINDLVGDQLEGFLENKNSTATLSKESKKVKKKYSKKLDEIILSNKIDKVDVIKSDTDGYDVEVLRSGFKTIQKFKPILFFEYMNTQSTQLGKYMDFISELKLIDYNKFIILDNYGNIILEDNNIEKIREIMTGRKIVDIYCLVE